VTLQERVRHLVEQMLSKAEPIHPDNTIRRALKSGNISVRTLARIADRLGFEVVVNARRKL
jgi:hypothetical protein